MTANQTSLETACQLLRQSDCLSQPGTTDRMSLRQALCQVAQASDYQILGICADTFTQAKQALESYAAALDYQPANLTPLEGAVYIKFNPISGLCYVDAYNGNHRGVLVSCQSSDDGINEMFGHLPLDLFLENPSSSF